MGVDISGKTKYVFYLRRTAAETLGLSGRPDDRLTLQLHEAGKKYAS